MRRVPWVAGCCGPMLRVMPSVSSSTLTRSFGRLGGDVGELVAIGDRGHDSSGLSSVFVVAGHLLDVDDAGPRLHAAGQQRIVLAQRIPLELRRQVDVAQAGMARRT